MTVQATTSHRLPASNRSIRLHCVQRTCQYFLIVSVNVHNVLNLGCTVELHPDDGLSQPSHSRTTARCRPCSHPYTMFQRPPTEPPGLLLTVTAPPAPADPLPAPSAGAPWPPARRHAGPDGAGRADGCAGPAGLARRPGIPGCAGTCAVGKGRPLVRSGACEAR